MKKQWVYSDCHFRHKNVIAYGARPFSDLEEMEKVMIERYNALVHEEDNVFWLGDVSFTTKEILYGILQQMNGYKILIMGNHDWNKKRAWWLDAGFHEVSKYPIIVRNNIILSHRPLELGGDFTFFNIHGHIHQYESPSLEHFNVSVEATDYKPVLVDDIEKIYHARKKARL